jgi:hypothetical protein
MAINAMIPLAYDGGAGIQTPQLGGMIQNANALRALRMQAAQQQQQNALAQLLANPDARDQQGNVKPETLNRVMAISPQIGGVLIKQQAAAQEQRSLAQLHQAETTKQKQALVHDEVLSPSILAYDDALKAGMSPTQAAQKAQQVYADGLSEVKKSGLFSEDETQQMPGNFDPIRVRSRAMTYKDFLAQNTKNDADTRADRREDRMERHDDVLDANATAREARAEAGGGERAKWEVLTDPKTGAQYRYDPVIAKATTLDGKPYAPQGAEKVGTEKPGGGPGGKLDADTLDQMAGQYLAGDKSVMQNLGRGAQGAENLIALRERIDTKAKAAGMSPADVATKLAEFEGQKSGERALGTRSAQMGMAVDEAKRVIPLALEASQAVPRSQFVALNRAIEAVQRGTGDANVARFVAANTSLINVYARAMNPNGAPTVSDKEHAREMLAIASNPEQYAAVVDQIGKEIASAQKAPGDVKVELSGKAPAEGDGGGKPSKVIRYHADGSRVQ